MTFTDRRDAGRRLAGFLRQLRGPDLVVLGLPGGGVPVAAEVARELHAPLDVIVVRKLGVPVQRELAMGALGEDGVRVLNEDVILRSGVGPAELAATERQERDALRQRVDRFRRGRPRIPLDGRTALIVDDGVATGSTARAACDVARAHGAARVILATPVAPPSAVRMLGQVADQVICVISPDGFAAVGEWYDDFSHVSDDEVAAILASAGRLGPSPETGTGAGAQACAPGADTHEPDATDPGADTHEPGATDPGADTHEPDATDPGAARSGEVTRDVLIRSGPVRLPGTVTIPPDPIGMVVFVHGSGSSRHSPRNRYVARLLHQARLATLLFDLLTPEEAADRANVFDIATLAGRLSAAIDAIRSDPGTPPGPVGLFGASTGAAAALTTAAARQDIGAVVSRGGRPDLAGGALSRVRAPTLLIVGGRDDVVLELNRAAQARLRCPNRLSVVPDATHLFEEPGTLSAAAEIARDWFVEALGGVTAHTPVP